MLVTIVTITPIFETVNNQFSDVRIGHHQFEVGKSEFIFNPERFLKNVEERVYKENSAKNSVANPSIKRN